MIRLIGRILRLGVVAGLLFGWYVMTTIPIFALKTDEVTADTIVVLGAAVWGNRPSPVYRERLNHAIGLYEAGAAETIIFTGGVGIKSPIAEGEMGRLYALAQGVPDSAIFVDDQSTSTIENLTAVREIMDENQLESALIVSTPVHMKRAMLVAKRVGIDAYTSPTRSTRWLAGGLRVQLYIRELLGYTHHALLWYP